MMATILRFGDAPDTSGGDFERECVEYLGKHLPKDCAVIAHLPLPTIHGGVYDMDIVVAGPWGYEILECKKMHAEVTVGENFLRGTAGFIIDSVFTPLQNKCRALLGKLRDAPFRGHPDVRVFGRVVVPTDTAIRFDHRDHELNRKVMRLAEVPRELVTHVTPSQVENVVGRWEHYRASYQSPGEFRPGYIGRFLVRKRLPSRGGVVEYLAMDEPPCKADVHLLEIPFPNGMRGQQLDGYLAEATHAMSALRRLRHPLIQCVIGHFFTGSSLVQVSDYFEGQPLEDVIGADRLSFDDKLQVMTRVCEALIYCHEQSVFHRNLHPTNILVGSTFADVRVTGFECVKDSLQGRTALASEMNKRDKRLIPPEELNGRPVENFRLYDIFQVGVLFFWILEDGRWPFGSTHEYVNGNGELPFANEDESRVMGLRELISGMLALTPTQRPNVLQRIIDSLHSLA